MPVFGHFLAAKFLSVDCQFHFIAVAVHPYIDAVAFMPFQVPVRQDMQHRFVRPPGLQIKGLIFREAAVIEHAEL